MTTLLEQLYVKEIVLQEALAKIHLKTLRKPGDLKRAVQLEQELLGVANKIKGQKIHGRT